MKQKEPVFEQFLPSVWSLGDTPDIEHGHEMEFWVVVRLRNNCRLIRRFWYVNFDECGYTDEQLACWDGRTDEGGEPFFFVGWCQEAFTRSSVHSTSRSTETAISGSRPMHQ